MSARPSVLVLDVNETLSDLASMSSAFADVGASSDVASRWFPDTLRDAFALTIAGENVAFADVGAGVLRASLASVVLDRPLDDAVDHVMAAFTRLPVHPDVVDGLSDLAEAGFRLATLSNGAVENVEALLTRAGVRDLVDVVLSVEDAPLWKPDGSAYRYAVDALGVVADEAMLVAVHPWDLDGASRAGLATAFIDRSDSPWPTYFRRPDVTATSFVDLAEQLTRDA